MKARLHRLIGGMKDAENEVQLYDVCRLRREEPSGRYCPGLNVVVVDALHLLPLPCSCGLVCIQDNLMQNMLPMYVYIM